MYITESEEYYEKNAVWLVFGIWFWYQLGRYSYNELIERFKNMSKHKRDIFEECLYTILYVKVDDEHVDGKIDGLIQMTLGLSNSVDLYKFVKNYNDKEKIELLMKKLEAFRKENETA